MVVKAQVPARAIAGAMIRLAVWCAAAGGAAAQAPPAVPPPMEQRTADCAISTYASDVLVCADAELRAADRRLASLLETSARAGVTDDGVWLEPATAWFRRRSLCAFSAEHRGCLAAAYRERMAVLELLLATRGWASPLELACDQDSWRGQWRRTRDGLEGMVLVDGAGHTVGVALSGGDGPDWHPFLRFEADGHDLTLSWAGGIRRCRQTTALDVASNEALRGHVDAVDAMAAAAKADRAGGRLDARAYGEVLRRLREHELAVYAEARLRRFTQAIDEHYWHRSRLKFPSVTQLELDRIADLAAIINP
jgi:uncharacterized protein